MDLLFILFYCLFGGNLKWNLEECEDCKGKGYVEGEGLEVGNGRLCLKWLWGFVGK